MPEEYYDTDFPNLKKLGFKRTSEPAYPNCIAFVVGDEKRKWWPGEYPRWSPDFWPKEAPAKETLDAFLVALATKDFRKCDNGDWEPEFEKTAIYARGEEVSHAALQVDEVTWKSKLGADEDIEHTLAGLEGPLYGKVVAYLKRQRKT